MTIPKTMQAVLLTAHGGPDVLRIEANWPVPAPQSGQVLIRVGAAGVNNTDINTRIGWYSKTVTGDTNSTASAGDAPKSSEDAAWSGAGINFPRIQGADICGTIVASGDGQSSDRIGERVVVAAMQPQEDNDEGLQCITIGSEIDGGFADYVVCNSDMALKIDSDLSDVELASFPCAYSTAENMLERIGLKTGERVLITGASGGVGSAAVQLAKRRGCFVTAVASKSKHEFLEQLGADQLVDRNVDLSQSVKSNSLDVVVDVVAGSVFPHLLDTLKRGGRYICAGAIGGPITELDVRTVYLKDLTVAGSTWQPLAVMKNLVGYIERGEIRPVVSKIYPLSKITDAQEDFITKKYPGKLVLIPDSQMKK